MSRMRPGKIRPGRLVVAANGRKWVIANEKCSLVETGNRREAKFKIEYYNSIYL